MGSERGKDELGIKLRRRAEGQATGQRTQREMESAGEKVKATKKCPRDQQCPACCVKITKWKKYSPQLV